MIKHIILSILFVFVRGISTFGQTIDATDISFVSINPYTNEVSVAWYKSQSPNISFVRIHYIYDETTLIKAKKIVDIPANTDDTTYFKTDSIDYFVHEANEVPLSFATDAYSNNGDNSTTLREYHTTMIASAKRTSCPSTIEISWTPYFAYSLQVSKYELIETNSLHQETVVATFSKDQLKAIVPINNNTVRQFFIRAVFTDINGAIQTSSSNMATSIQTNTNVPTFITNENIVVQPNNDIAVEFIVDSSSDFNSYALFYSVGNVSKYTFLDSIQVETHKQTNVLYTHTNGFKTDSLVYYKLSAYNNCGDLLLSSQPFSPIQLYGSEISTTEHLLRWSNQKIWNDLNAHYKLIQITNNEIEKSIFETNNQFSYIDDISKNYQVNSLVCYRIEAQQIRNSMPKTSISNIFCIEKQYHISIPNAFNPYSAIAENSIFKPKYAFVSGSYSLEIFNRNGATVFYTEKIDEGWNGKVNEHYAPQGMYHYKLILELPSGEKVERVGGVSLLFN